MPSKVSVNIRPTITAGLANEVEVVGNAITASITHDTVANRSWLRRCLAAALTASGSRGGA
jgi:hypothetical protein